MVDINKGVLVVSRLRRRLGSKIRLIIVAMRCFIFLGSKSAKQVDISDKLVH